MNLVLKKLLDDLNIDAKPELAIRFSIACVDRVLPLLTDPQIIHCLETGHRYLDNCYDEDALQALAVKAAGLAASHAGNHGIDGSGQAAVSASHAVALALAGRALDAAEYAAYARVYAYASYAVTEPDAFTSEYDWQVKELNRLVAKRQANRHGSPPG